MKKIKLMLVALVAVLFMGVGSVNAQGKNPQTVIIKVYEAPFTSFKAQMVITEPSGTSRSIDLKNINIKSLKEEVSGNSLLIQSEINNWKKEGYQINGMSGSSLGNISITTIILSNDE